MHRKYKTAGGTISGGQTQFCESKLNRQFEIQQEQIVLTWALSILILTTNQGAGGTEAQLFSSIQGDRFQACL